MRASFDVDRDHVGAGVRKFFQILFRLDDHQMGIKRKVGYASHRLNHQWTNSDVGNETPVHYVDMDQTGSAAVGCFYVFTQTGKIGRQNGWGYFYHYSV